MSEVKIQKNVLDIFGFPLKIRNFTRFFYGICKTLGTSRS